VPPLQCLRELHFGRILSVVETEMCLFLHPSLVIPPPPEPSIPAAPARLLRQDFSQRMHRHRLGLVRLSQKCSQEYRAANLPDKDLAYLEGTASF